MLSCQYTHSPSHETFLSIYLHYSHLFEIDINVALCRLNSNNTNSPYHEEVLSIYKHNSQISEINNNVGIHRLNKIFSIKVRKMAKIRKRYNQVPHLTQDITWEINKKQ